MDEGRAADVIFLDFSKAFKTVFHSILVSQLGCCGVDGWTTGWVKKRWDGGAQKAVLRGSWSPSRTIKSEVLGQSTWGAVLFNI